MTFTVPVPPSGVVSADLNFSCPCRAPRLVMVRNMRADLPVPRGLFGPVSCRVCGRVLTWHFAWEAAALVVEVDHA
jgi:hypothetical protein